MNNVVKTFLNYSKHLSISDSIYIKKYDCTLVSVNTSICKTAKLSQKSQTGGTQGHFNLSVASFCQRSSLTVE